MKFDRNTVLGFIVLAGLFFGYFYFTNQQQSEYRKQKAADQDTKITRQNRRKFWYNQTHDYYKWVKPDIVINKDDRTIIIDTKWKIIQDNKPSYDDLKQMFVYNLLWDAEKSLLVYPGVNSLSSWSFLHFELSESKKSSKEEELFNHCSLAFINILSPEGKLISIEEFKTFLEVL